MTYHLDQKRHMVYKIKESWKEVHFQYESEMMLFRTRFKFYYTVIH